MSHLADLKWRLMSICLMPTTVIWQPPGVKIKPVNTAVINLADKEMIYENLIITL